MKRTLTIEEITYLIPDEVITRTNSAESVTIMNLDDYGDFFEIDGPAAFAWIQMTNKKRLSSIVALLEKEYSKPREIVVEKLTELLSDLEENDLIETNLPE